MLEESQGSNSKAPPTVRGPRRRRGRTVVMVVAVVVGVILLGLVTSGFWLPWILKPALNAGGIVVGRSDRGPHGRVALDDVRFESDSIEFTAARVEALQPLGWLTRRLGGGRSGEASGQGTGSGLGQDIGEPLIIRSWRLRLLSPESEPEPDDAEPMESVAELMELIESIMVQVTQFYPEVLIEDGEVHMGEDVVYVRRVSGGLDKLLAEVMHDRLEEPLLIELGRVENAAGGARYRLEAATVLLEEPLTTELGFSRENSNDPWGITGEGGWGKNRWQLDGLFGATGWLPERLSVAAPDWDVSLKRWNVPGYSGVTGGLLLTWAEERLVFDLTGRAEPILSDETDPDIYPEAVFDVSGAATMGRLHLEQFRVRSPGLSLMLDGPLDFDWSTRQAGRSAKFAIDIQPGDIPFLSDVLGEVAAALPEGDGTVETNVLAGSIVGGLHVAQSEGLWPTARLELASDGLTWDRWVIETLGLDLKFEWPDVELSGLDVDFGDSGRIQMAGDVGLGGKFIEIRMIDLEANVKQRLAGGMVPPGMGWDDLNIEAAIQGMVTPSYDQLRSRGSVTVEGVVAPSVSRLDPVKFSWQPDPRVLGSDGFSGHLWEVGIETDGAGIGVGGGLQFSLEEGLFTVPITEFEWRREAKTKGDDEANGTEGGGGASIRVVGLEAPVEATFQLAESGTKNEGDGGSWSLLLPEIRVSPRSEAGAVAQVQIEDGPTASVSADVAWPVRGAVRLGLDRWGAEWLRDWVKIEGLDPFASTTLWGAVLEGLQVRADWDRGPMDYGVELSIETPHPLVGFTDPAGGFGVFVRAQGGADQLRIEEIRIQDQDGIWLTANGFIPLVISPGDSESVVRWNDAALMKFSGHMDRRPDLTVQVPDKGTVRIEGLKFDTEIEGSVAAPGGSLQLGFDRLEVEAAAESGFENLPEVTEFRFDLGWNPAEVRLGTLRLLVAGQPIEARFLLPLPEGFWKSGGEEERPLPDLSASSGRIDIGPLELSAFEKLIPSPLRAQGVFEMHTQWDSGFAMTGGINFSDLATNPLPAAGAVQDVEGDIQMAGPDVRIEKLSAMLGGRQASMSGQINLEPALSVVRAAGSGWANVLTNLPLPHWDIQMKGERLPVMRSPGMVIRTGIDIRTTHDGTDTPLITGLVQPTDSVFITDMKTLIPSGPSGPAVSPPYVSVDHPVLGEWRVALRIEGDRFLRVRTPVFQGVMSANMTLQGRLKEPVLLGDVRIAEGNLMFPFGNLKVNQGLVSLSELDPSQPNILIRAGSMVYGYQIAMDISGTAEAPEVAFTSTPPLNSEDILLMLTAGKLPQDELTFSNQQKASKLAAFVGKGFIDSWSLSEPKESRLNMRSGEAVSARGRVTYSLDYLLIDRWSLTGEYDEYDAINAGVKFRLLQR